MMLFSPSDLTSKRRPTGGARKRRLRIPTGTQRLVESSNARRDRAPEIAWKALIAAIRRSSSARLELLKGRPNCDRVPCPWERLTGCGDGCRCGGVRTVTIEFLRTHYTQLAATVARCACPVSMQGRSA